MGHRFLCVTLAILLILALAMQGAAGGGDGTSVFADAYAAAAPAATEDELVKRLACKSAILMERSTGQVLYEMEPDVRMPPASITKVMTLLLVCEALERGDLTLEDTVSASEHACSMGGSQIWLEPGEVMTVRDLLKATAIQSANDASVALGELVGGSEDGFVLLMNARAAELGMVNTTFKNASGLDAEGHLTTARDIALMSAELLRHDMIREYVTTWMDTLRNGETGLTNTNKLLKRYSGTTGLKTGTTDGAGTCLSASAMRDGMELIAVTMGSATSDERFASAKALLDYGFGRWQLVQPDSVAEQLLPIPVKGGIVKEVAVRETQPPQLLTERTRSGAVESRVNLSPMLEAPVAEGQVCGKVELFIGEDPVGQYELVTAAAVEKLTFWKAMGILLAAAAAM